MKAGVKPVYVIGACDTKEAELRYAVEQVRKTAAPALTAGIPATPMRATARKDAASDAPGKPFHDPQAGQALFGAIRAAWQPAPRRQLAEASPRINGPAFAGACVHAFRSIAGGA